MRKVQGIRIWKRSPDLVARGKGRPAEFLYRQGKPSVELIETRDGEQDLLGSSLHWLAHGLETLWHYQKSSKSIAATMFTGHSTRPRVPPSLPSLQGPPNPEQPLHMRKIPNLAWRRSTNTYPLP